MNELRSVSSASRWEMPAVTRAALTDGLSRSMEGPRRLSAP
jgi:hypothetical protein